MPSHPTPPQWAMRATVCATLFALLLVVNACTFTVQPPTPTPPAAGSSTPNSISGNVTRGESFSTDLAANLTVQLLPIDYGWEIWVGDPTYSTKATDNFAMPVTPPFHTINTRMIEGWHFRNNDNSGPNLPGDKNVNAPQTVRAFCFVGNADDFDAALAAFANGLPALAEAVANDSFPLHRATLTITDYTLGNLVANETAWFEEIKFTITLDPNHPCDLF